MNKILTLTVVTAALATVPAMAQLPPEKAAASFSVVDGLQIELFAAEPMLVNPTSMDVDHLGRVWVAEAVNYRRINFNRPILRPEGDRIVILTDKDGDGKADEATVFYQGKELYGPMGIAVAKDAVGPGWKVYVGQSPDILVFEDKDGDGKADGPPKKMFAGCFRGFDHDHGVHGLNIGPDGKMYFSVGDQGVQGLKDCFGKVWTSNATDCRAGTIWRCDLDGTNLELIAHNFRNEYKPCVDSFGSIFVSDNDDDGNQQTRICYVMPGGNYGYHPRGPGQTHWHEEQPGVVPKILRTGFGSPTGMCIYEGTLLPTKYRGQPLGTDAGPRHLRCYHLTPDGAGHQVEREDMVTSTDNWFRPSDVVVAPDGSVFVSDWYDPGVGGHGMGDWTRGRVYRVTPKGHKGYAVPKVDLVKNGILDALVSPNLATQYLARQVVRENKNIGAIDLMQAGLSRSGKNATDADKYIKSILEARAEWLAFGKGGTDFFVQHPEGIVLLFAADTGKVTGAWDNTNCELIRCFSAAYPDWRSLPPPVFSALRTGLNKATAMVRGEALVALRRTDPETAKPVILDLAKHFDGKDVFYRCAIGIAVGTEPKRREIILADFEKQFPNWDDRTAGLVFELRPPAVMAKLGDYLADPKLTAAQKAHILDILATSGDLSSGTTLLKLLAGNPTPEIRGKVLENLKAFLPSKWSGLRTSAELKAAIDKLLADPATRPQAVDLIAAGALDDYLPVLVKLAEDGTQPLPDRQTAVRGLGSFKSQPAIDALAKLIAVDALQMSAIQALGQIRTEPSIKPLQTVVKDEKQMPAVRVEALAALAAGQPGTKWLIDEQKAGSLPKDLVSDAGRLLRNSPFQGMRNQAMIAFPAGGRMDPKKLPSIAELARRKGNVENGRRLFVESAKNDTECAKCHMVRGQGGQVGPDLSMIGKKASRENLFESILLPSKAIADQFVSWNVETTAGVVVTGLLVVETPSDFTIRDANGKDTVIAKKDVESRNKSLVSLMPDNLVSHLTPDELVDMVEYLFTLKTPALTPEAWHILGPFNSPEDACLDRDFGPEKGIDLGAKCQGKSGDIRWRTVRPTATGYVDLAALHGSDSTNSLSYMTRAIESPADQEVTLLVGTDDGCRLWVNGELVLSHNRHEAASPERDQVTLKLKKGTNTILLKVNNGGNPHGFYFTVLSEQELKLVPMERQ